MDVQFVRDLTPARSGYLSRRSTLLGGAAAVLASALVARGLAAAQDASPEAADLVVEALGAGMPTGTPGRQLILARATFPTGFTLPAHTHPGPVVAFVESGTYGFTAVAGEASYVTRAAAPETPEAPALGTEVQLSAGDALFHDEEVVGSTGPSATSRWSSCSRCCLIPPSRCTTSPTSTRERRLHS